MAEGFDLSEVAPGVFACIGRDGVANSGFVVGRQGVAVIDAQASPALGQQMRHAIESVTPVPVTHGFITHHHGDHWYGIGAWPEARWFCHPRCLDILAAIAAEEGIREGELLTLSASLRIFVGDLSAAVLSRFPAHPIHARLRSPEYAQARLFLPRALPEEKLHGGTFDLGGIAVEVRALGVGHGDDDITLWVPDRGVAFLGDIAFVERIPAVTSIYVTEWSELSERLSRTDAGLFVPGHGPPCPPASLRIQAAYLDALRRFGEGDPAAEREIGSFSSLPRFTAWHPLNVAILTETKLASGKERGGGSD